MRQTVCRGLSKKSEGGEEKGQEMKNKGGWERHSKSSCHICLYTTISVSGTVCCRGRHRASDNFLFQTDHRLLNRKRKWVSSNTLPKACSDIILLLFFASLQYCWQHPLVEKHINTPEPHRLRLYSERIRVIPNKLYVISVPITK